MYFKLKFIENYTIISTALFYHNQQVKINLYQFYTLNCITVPIEILQFPSSYLYAPLSYKYI